jgi:hypothetical protein
LPRIKRSVRYLLLACLLALAVGCCALYHDGLGCIQHHVVACSISLLLLLLLLLLLRIIVIIIIIIIIIIIVIVIVIVIVIIS